MHRYETLEQLGNGSFGEVVRARSLKTNEVVAIKKMKALFPTWEACLQLRELKSLRVLRHENIVQLKEVIQNKEELYFVFEYMQSSLCRVMRQIKKQQQAASVSSSGACLSSADDTNSSSSSGAGTGADGAAPALPWFSEAQIRSIMYQLFCGLAHMHKHGFFHRDIKPENLLCHDETLKIADLGQAREIRSRPPFTDYVATRWYRSPELLLRSTTYNSPIDLWACGCIMAELYLQAPLFPGLSEADQMCRICKVLGTPTKENWPDGMTMVAQMQFKFPKCAPVPWSHLLPQTTSKAALQLIQELIQYDPSRRLTAAQALQHRFFDQAVARPMLTTPVVPLSAVPSSSVLPAKAEFKSAPSYATTSSYGGGGGVSSKKVVGATGDDTLASDASSRWSRKDHGASSDNLGSSRKDWSASSAYDLSSTMASSSSSHWSAKQTASTMDKLFLHSPRESESWTADAKTSRRDRPALPPGASATTSSSAIGGASIAAAAASGKTDLRLAAAAKQRDKRGASNSGGDGFYSARKFIPSPEEEDGEPDNDNRVDDDDDDDDDSDEKSSERGTRRALHDAPRRAGDAAQGNLRAFRKHSEDHLLQDLLDEFIA